MSAHASLSNSRPRSALRPVGDSLYRYEQDQRQCHRAVTWLDLDNRGTQTSGAPYVNKGGAPVLTAHDNGPVTATRTNVNGM